MNFVPLVAMGLLVYAIINFLRRMFGGQFGSASTQLVVWAAGVVVVVLAAQTQFTQTLYVNGVALAKLSIWSQIFLGLIAGSTGAFGKDLLKSVDNTQTAALPGLFDKLFGAQPPAPVVTPPVVLPPTAGPGV